MIHKPQRQNTKGLEGFNLEHKPTTKEPNK